MLMGRSTEEVKRMDVRMVKVDLNLTMGIFMKEHFDKENEKDLESVLSIRKEWLMKGNGKMINDRDMVDKFGRIKVVFKDSGTMEGCNLEFLLGLMEAIIRVSSLIM